MTDKAKWWAKRNEIKSQVEEVIKQANQILQKITALPAQGEGQGSSQRVDPHLCQQLAMERENTQMDLDIMKDFLKKEYGKQGTIIKQHFIRQMISTVNQAIEDTARSINTYPLP